MVKYGFADAMSVLHSRREHLLDLWRPVLTRQLLELLTQCVVIAVATRFAPND